MKFFAKRKANAGVKSPSLSEEWCVAQELRPFGYRIVERGLSESDARSGAARSDYLQAMPLRAALDYNHRSVEDEDFFSLELRRQVGRDRRRP